MKHYLLIPFTGLGLYNGFRGNEWLENRIKIFKHFVVPSIQAQTNQNFTIWACWRKEERRNKHVVALKAYLEDLFPNRVIFTYSGIPFYDDKYSNEEANIRLIDALHGAMHGLVDDIGDVKDVIYTIQPSDDCYHSGMVEEIQTLFKNTDYQGIGYKHGYIMNYLTKELREYNPETNPPFVSIRFRKETFIDPFRHAKYTALRRDVGKYKQNTPCPSHEYYPDCLKYMQIPKRGFLVGTHSENISTHFNIPYAGDNSPLSELENFGIMGVPPILIKHSLRKRLFKKLPHRVQRKLRYIFGERFYSPIKKFLHV